MPNTQEKARAEKQDDVGVADAALALHCTYSRALDLGLTGKLEMRRVGRRFVITKSSLDRYLAANS